MPIVETQRELEALERAAAAAGRDYDRALELHCGLRGVARELHAPAVRQLRARRDDLQRQLKQLRQVTR